MNLSPPGVFGLAGVLDADLDATQNRFKLTLYFIVFRLKIMNYLYNCIYFSENNKYL